MTRSGTHLPTPRRAPTWTRRWLLPAALPLFLGLLGASSAAEGAAAPPPPTWGEPVEGLQARLELVGTPAAKGGLALRVSLRNQGEGPVLVGEAKDVFGWLFLASPNNKLFTDKVFYVKPADTWPSEMAPGGSWSIDRVELGGRQAYSFSKGLIIANGYPSPKPGERRQLHAAGVLREVIVPGKALVKWMLFLPRPKGKPLLVVSNMLEIDVGAPDLAALPKSERQTYVAGLMAQFRESAVAAKRARGVAVATGEQIVPELAAAVTDPEVAEFGRMWLATALADIGGERAAATLMELLNRAPGGVCNVVAYHGPKMRHAGLDQAIVTTALAGKPPAVAMWALRGFAAFGKDIPAALKSAALASTDPRIHGTVIEAMAARPNRGNVAKLVELVGAKDEHTRALAAKGLGIAGKASKATVGALIAALGGGDQVAPNACEALGKLTKRSAPYDPEADKAVKQRVIESWRKWWGEAAPDYR